MDEIYLSIDDGVNVVLNVLRVGGDDRAVVVVVRILEFIPLVRNTWIENMLDALVDQPLDMPVSQLRRIALGFTGDGLYAKLVDLPGGRRRKDHTRIQAL